MEGPQNRGQEGFPRPLFGWGVLSGVIILWGVLVLMTHLSDLGVNPSVLARLYNPANYPGFIPAGDLVLLYLGHAAKLGAAGLICAAALGFGLEAVSLAAPAWPGPNLRVLFSLAAGFPLFALAMLGGGLLGFWHWTYPLALAGAGVAVLWRRGKELSGAGIPRGGSRAGKAAKAAFALAAGFCAMVALSPEVFYDSLVYHVADPFNWAKAGKITFLPYNFFSNFPFTFEMLFGAGILLGSDSISRLVHLSISLCAAGVLGWTAFWIAGGGFTAGWLAALIFLTTPLIASSAWMTGIDAGLACYEGAAVLSFALWWKSRREGGRLLGSGAAWLLLSAVFCGMGMGAKMTLGLVIGLLGLGVIVRMSVHAGKEALKPWLFAILLILFPLTLSNIKELQAAGFADWGRYFAGAYGLAGAFLLFAAARRTGAGNLLAGAGAAVIFGLVASLFMLPWSLKSLVFTGNPVYPFAYSLFDSFHVSPPRMAYQMGEFREFSFRPLLEWLIHPWKLTRISGFSNNSAGGALYLAMLPVLFMFRGVDWRVRLLGVFLAGRYLLWSNVSNILRYFAPGLALMGVLIAVYLDRYLSPRPNVRRAGLAAAAAFTLVNVFVLMLVAQASGRFMGVVLGLETKRSYYLSERSTYPAPPYAGCEYMNASLDPSAGVLFLGEARGYFCKRRLVAATVFDFPVLVEICGDSPGPREVIKRLKQMGIGHVYFNEAEARRTAGYRLFDWGTERNRRLFEDFLSKHMSLVWKGGWQEVYEIRPAGVGERTAALKLVHLPFDEYDPLSALERRAYELARAGSLGEAEATARELVAKAPRVAAGREMLAQILALQSRDSEAIKSYRDAVALGLCSTEAHYNLGILYQRNGRNRESQSEFAKARELEWNWSGR